MGERAAPARAEWGRNGCLPYDLRVTDSAIAAALGDSAQHRCALDVHRTKRVMFQKKFERAELASEAKQPWFHRDVVTAGGFSDQR